MSKITGSNHRCRAQFKCVQSTDSRRPAFCWKWAQRSVYTTTTTILYTTTTTTANSVPASPVLRHSSLYCQLCLCISRTASQQPLLPTLSLHLPYCVTAASTANSVSASPVLPIFINNAAFKICLYSLFFYYPLSNSVFYL